jgi:hypothetical protein
MFEAAKVRNLAKPELKIKIYRIYYIDNPALFNDVYQH